MDSLTFIEFIYSFDFQGYCTSETKDINKNRYMSIFTDAKGSIGRKDKKSLILPTFIPSDEINLLWTCNLDRATKELSEC